MKLHLHFATRYLDASVAFYRTLLAAEPAKQYDDYALFLTEDPGLELALDANPNAKAGEDAHYGVAVKKAQDVDDAHARLRAAGYTVEVENDRTCCYALQHKVWATDPDGRRWETYFVVAETGNRDDEPACCTAEAAGATALAACC